MRTSSTIIDSPFILYFEHIWQTNPVKINKNKFHKNIQMDDKVNKILPPEWIISESMGSASNFTILFSKLSVSLAGQLIKKN